MALIEILRARKRTDCESLGGAALSELAVIFPEDKWGIEQDFNYYTAQNVANLWENELHSGVKRRLEAAGVGQNNFKDWLEDVHFVNIGVYLKSLFPRYRSNAGWRIVLMSVPRAQVIVVGLASHYQNAQNHNKLGGVSNLLFDIAEAGLAAKGEPPLAGRKVAGNDWDQTGLISPPMTSIAGVNVSPEALYLKDVRTTTVKKILASFISIKALPATASVSDLQSELLILAQSATALAAGIYPFGALEDFEGFRALALQDAAAATTRLALRTNTAKRAVVRVYYGPPGTGKTLAAVREAVKLVDPLHQDSGDTHSAFAKFNEHREQCAFVTFHPSLQYEDLVESIRPQIVANEPSDENVGDAASNVAQDTGRLAYRIHEGVLLRMIRRALENPKKDYVIVVDEINRGDVSRILGPLISSLEADKRLGAPFPIGIELQYPRAGELESRMFMPSNLHIVGTMNSSDRNIALVDHALRRRFEFIEVPPEPALLAVTSDTSPIDCKRLLVQLNERIEHLLDSDHCIGHGYFMGCSTNGMVIERMATKVFPLLKEYFFGNEGMLLLVVGDVASTADKFFRLTNSDSKFIELFGVDPEAAGGVGYRPHSIAPTLRLDLRFWNPLRLIPGPDDESYAVRCIQKIYDTKVVP